MTDTINSPEARNPLLGAGEDCLTDAELAILAGEVGSGQDRSRWTSHIESCARCATELEMLHRFERAETSDEEAGDVEWIAHRLEERQSEIFGQPRERPERKVLSMPARRWWMIPLAAAAGVVFVVVAVDWNRGGPGPLPRPDTAAVVRSGQVALVAPAGDLETPPESLRWTPVDSAARYRVTVSEVDRTVVWSGEATGVVVSAPAVVRTARAGKTMYWEVEALDDAGNVIASSPRQEFRVVKGDRP